MNGHHAIYGYFKPEETRCKCGCRMDITDELRRRLNLLRKTYGGPIYIASGARCPKYNAKVGGKARSFHTLGMAADIILPRDADTREHLLRTSFEIDFGGRGFYGTFIHVDTREQPAYWTG